MPPSPAFCLVGTGMLGFSVPPESSKTLLCMPRVAAGSPSKSGATQQSGGLPCGALTLTLGGGLPCNALTLTLGGFAPCRRLTGAPGRASLWRPALALGGGLPCGALTLAQLGAEASLLRPDPDARRRASL
ncbi:hypothetical protein CYMTET_8774 [Cymbomonas tetramitiformis]|uniref:Uncharacterized protein n=1 Tax=Cymbomonas tetramitiformis TaxID=36881 RepID=A0AAE0GSV9_9CHLO|nr:hypothetical protein CYMTET_8774 [Cymbomonas tetramitiformis]